ncbi:MAG TPA: dienelactone hydrolase family protein [Burkholderiaceae bacterium]|nr:dienelactone hydrolase family protein [Burkholderiaceae bacterium]
MPDPDPQRSAPAAGPACATEIHTDAAGLRAGMVSIPVGDGHLAAYRAVPAGVARAPVLLVVSEIFGLHRHIADVARRFAQRGYLAIAPELFARQGDPSRHAEVERLMAEVVSRVPDAQVMADLDACVAWAGVEGGDLERLGVTGFCWGGRITWLYAVHQPRLKAGVAWYGRLDGPRDERRPVHPIDAAAGLKAPVLGLYGEADAGIPLADVARMRQALAGGGAAARRSRIEVYPAAPHAFLADYRPNYRAEPARDGWQRCLDWLAAEGVA